MNRISGKLKKEVGRINKYKMKNMQSDCELVSKKNDISFICLMVKHPIMEITTMVLQVFSQHFGQIILNVFIMGP